jgi:hypothetical protein
MDSLKLHPGLPRLTLLRPASGPSLKWPYGCFRVAHPQGGRLAAVFYPLCHPTPHIYAQKSCPLHTVARPHAPILRVSEIGARREVSKVIEDGRRPPAGRFRGGLPVGRIIVGHGLLY